MKKLIKGFSQYVNECGCEGGGMLPEDGTGMDMGLDTTGTGVKDQTDATGSVMEEDEEGEEHSEHKEIKLTAKGATIEVLLHKIKELSDSGVSFEIKISAEGEEGEEESFIWDGDGDDSIGDLEIEGEEEEEGEGEESGEEGEEYGEEGEGDEPEESDDEPEESDDDDQDEHEGHIKPFESFVNKGKKKVNETITKGETVGGVTVPGMIGPKTGGKHVKVEEKTITQKNKSYPISGPASLKKAEHAFGRSKNKAKTKAHIKSAAKELGLTKQLSDKWK